MNNNRAALVESFRQESEECLIQLEQHLLELEEQPHRRDLLDVVFRVTHTLKGNGALLEFHSFEKLWHSIEDLLDRMRTGNEEPGRDLITLLLRSVDTLRECADSCIRGMDNAGESGLRLLRELGEWKTREHNLDCTDSAPTSCDTSGQSSSPTPIENKHRALRIDLDSLDRMMNLTGEIVIAQGRLQRMLQEIGGPGAGPLEVQGEISRLFAQLQEMVMKVRMVPIRPLFQQFYRPVRDLARKHGKLARLVIVRQQLEGA